MDTLRSYDDERIDDADVATSGEDPPLAIGTDERRMHVRAYNHWVSLLHGRPYPSIEDLDPASIADFGPHSVLLDFTRSIDNPAIAFLGRALREECGLDTTIARITDVPSRSLLSRLTDHYLQIIANRAPIGFEAEFVGTRGHTMLYRGILMPFSSNGDAIDFIYGVINWKERVDAGTQARLDAEVEAAVRSATRPACKTPIWADGPSASAGEPAADADDGDDAEPLAGQLQLARTSAAAAATADGRSRHALYRALGFAHDFALAAQEDAQAYADLLADAGIKVQARAPMTAVAKLVFGSDYDKTRLTEFAAVLSHARRHEVEAGALPALLEEADGGIKGVVKAERALRRSATPALAIDPAAKLQARAALATLSLSSVEDAGPGALVLLVGRVAKGGDVDIVADLRPDAALIARIARALD